MVDAVYNLGVLYLDDELPDVDLVDRYKTAMTYLNDYLARGKPDAVLQKREERKKKEEEKKKAQGLPQHDGNSDAGTDSAPKGKPR